MTVEDVLQPSTAPIVAAVITAAVSANMIFVKWLIQNFRDLRAELNQSYEATKRWLDVHEDHDQQRHEENLHRFEKVSVALARLGSSNGTK